MKKKYLAIVFIISFAVSCKAQNNYSAKFVNAVVEGEIYPSYYDYVFMDKELIEIYKKDTTRLKRDIDFFSRVKFDKPCNAYYFNKVKISLKNKLKEYRQACNKMEDIIIIDKVIKSLKIVGNMKKNDEYKDWGNFYYCFFEYPGDEKDFTLFTLLFMGENELTSFFSHRDLLEYWNSSVILDLTIGGGDFMDNYKRNGTDILFKRKAEFILKRWKNCKNPTIIKTMDAFKIALTKSE